MYLKIKFRPFHSWTLRSGYQVMMEWWSWMSMNSTHQNSFRIYLWHYEFHVPSKQNKQCNVCSSVDISFSLLAHGNAMQWMQLSVEYERDWIWKENNMYSLRKCLVSEICLILVSLLQWPLTQFRIARSFNNNIFSSTTSSCVQL